MSTSTSPDLAPQHDVAAPPSDADVRRVEVGARDKLLSQWCNGLRISHIAHNRSASFCARRGRILGTGVVVLTAIIGTSIFASVQNEPSTTARVVAGCLSVAATVLAALHTFLNYAERAAAHRHAAARYGSLRRELEEARAAPGDWDAVRAVVRNWNQLDEAAPDVPERLHACALQTVAARSPKPSFE